MIRTLILQLKELEKQLRSIVRSALLTENTGNGASRNEQAKKAEGHLPADTQVR